MPMVTLPLAAQSYGLDGHQGKGRRLLNMMAEKQPDASKGAFLLKSTPALVPYLPVGGGPISAMAAMPGTLYLVSGGQLYRYRTDGSGLRFLGDVGLPQAPPGQFPAISMALGRHEVVVVNPPGAWSVRHTQNSMVNLTAPGTQFPAGGASSVTHIDGFFVFTSIDGTFFFISSPTSAQDYDALDYASSERYPDLTHWVVNHGGELWLFGLHSVAVWYNSGAADFPFRERGGSVQTRGCGSFRSIAPLDRGLAFVGNDRIVYWTQGYQLQRISDHALEEQLSRTELLQEIRGFSWTWEGHAMYALQFPGTSGREAATFVFDASTGVWHEQADPQSNRWEPDCATRLDVLPVFGSYSKGMVYTLDPTLFTEGGEPIQREVVLPPLSHGGERAFMARLEVDMDSESGTVPGGLTLDWSDDRGTTYQAPRVLDTGPAGVVRRVYATRLGSYRDRQIRMRGTGRLSIYGVRADVQTGTN